MGYEIKKNKLIYEKCLQVSNIVVSLKKMGTNNGRT